MAGPLNTTASWLPFTLTLWFLGSAITQLFMGPIADRFGRRRTLIGGGIIYALSSILCGLSTGLWPFLIGRFLQGAMLGSMVVAGYATIHDSYDQKTAIQTLAWMGAITVVAPALGPLFGSAILAFDNWRMIFFSLAGLATLTLIGHYYVMPETSQAEKEPSSAIQVYGKILRNWRFMGQACAASCAIFAVIAWLTAGPWIVAEQFKQPGYYFGLYQAVIFVGFIIGSQLVKPLMKRFLLRKLVIFCLTLTVLVTAISFLTSYFYPQESIDFILEMCAIAVCLGISFPVLNRLAIESSDMPMGSRVAMFSATNTVAAVFASVVIGLVLPITTGVLSLIMFAGVALSVMLYVSTRPGRNGHTITKPSE
jgi:DHA1 family multidrug/chloramphenicol efflux transport protein-like MFS transporter